MFNRKLTAIVAAAGLAAVSLTGCSGSSKPDAQASTPAAALATAGAAAPAAGDTTAYCSKLKEADTTMQGTPDAKALDQLKQIQNLAPAEVKDDWQTIVDMIDAYLTLDGGATPTAEEIQKLQELVTKVGDAGAAIDKESKADCNFELGLSQLASIAG